MRKYPTQRFDIASVCFWRVCLRCMLRSGCCRARLARGKANLPSWCRPTMRIRQGSDHGRRLFRQGLATGISAGINRTNLLLNGRVTGFLGIQHDGELGIESIRCIETRSAVRLGRPPFWWTVTCARTPTALPADIESVTILKDIRSDRPLRSAGSERRGADHDHTAALS